MVIFQFATFNYQRVPPIAIASTSWVPIVGRQVNVIETLEKVIDVPVVKQVEVPQALGRWWLGDGQ